MIQYAYETVSGGANADTLKRLNDLGTQGWRVIACNASRSIVGGLVWTLERKIEPGLR